MDISREVMHPAHYSFGRKHEPIDVIADWDLNFNLGNVVKYIARAGRKEEDSILTDLKKAMFYLEDEIRRRDEDEQPSFEQSDYPPF